MQLSAIFVFAWIALTAIVNSIFHFTTPANVDAWAERNPTVAKIAAFCRRAGFEPIAMLGVLASFFSANPPPPGALGRKKDTTVAQQMIATLCIALALTFGVPVTGCAWWNGGGAAVVVTQAEQIIALALRGMSAEQIAIKLGIDVATVLIALLGTLDPKVQATPAFHEAVKVRAAMLAMPVDAGAR